MVLQKSPSNVETSIEDFIILLYGPPKIGKTTWASNLRDSYFIATEPGQKFVKCRKTLVRDWPTFRATIKALKSDPTVKVVVVDTIDNLYKFCFEYCCDKLGIDHPTDAAYGKGWESLSREWHKWITELAMMGKGLVFIGHSTEREVEERGIKIMKIVPLLPKTGFASINALADFILYATYERYKEGGKRKERRVLQTRATSNVEAGSRKLLPQTIPFDPANPSEIRRWIEGEESLPNTDSGKPVTPAAKRTVRTSIKLKKKG